MRFRQLLLFALLAWLSAAAVAGDALRVEAAWIREPPPGGRMLAGYVVLHNDGSAPIRVLGASGDEFGLVELHRSEIDDAGVARMREVPEILIAVGETVRLEPGGLHLMLMRPKRPIVAGDDLLLELLLDQGRSQSVSFPVRARGPN